MAAPHVATVLEVPGFQSITKAGITVLKIVVPDRGMVSRPFCWLQDGIGLMDLATANGTFGLPHCPYLATQLRELGLEEMRTAYRLQQSVSPTVFAAVNRMRQAMRPFRRVTA